jgi:ATP-binding cassette subfamily B protein
VRLDDVWFTYPGADSPALRGVSLTIAPGTLVALVGANGSGKTTVAKLICGLYAPQEGQVVWGTSASNGTPRIGVIFQDFIRYQLTAHDNVALGDPDRIEDRPGVVKSAKAANADEFLAPLSAGYGTRLSPEFEGGTDLSVGQWQRVAMARALFRDAPVLVLDEPTASLDPAAERELIDSTAEMFEAKAVLVISHRFANVVHADHIYVMDDGTVAEHGSHEELMELDGKYAEMYRLQASTFGGERDA